MKRIVDILIWAGLLLGLACCGSKGDKPSRPQEDTAAKKMFQGVWVNDDEGDVAFRVKGDTIYYPDSTSQPVYFYIMDDTLLMKGAKTVKYPIVKQAPHLFEFKVPSGDVVKLVKTNDKSYLKQFMKEPSVVLNQNKLIKRDTVVIHQGERYHLYVQVNPTTYKVYKSTYNNDGMEVDNVYYDNIVNLHIYHGAQKVFSRDFHKRDFSKKVPSTFLGQAILSDMIFKEIDGGGVHYQAVLAMPDTALSYLVEVIVSFKGRLSMELVE